MIRDNTTPMNANEYDIQINHTIPYYNEFYNQTIDIVKQCGYESIQWLDLGCGTGTLEQFVLKQDPDVKFVLVDPSENMLEQAKEKLKDASIAYQCTSSERIDYSERFHVVTAIQSHHYMQKEKRVEATERVWRALKQDGIYICFENVVPEEEELRSFELLRWGRYQQRHGKSEEEARLHNARCGVNYYPITVTEHIQLLRNVGFRNVYVFWRSYMQMGILAMK